MIERDARVANPISPSGLALREDKDIYIKYKIISSYFINVLTIFYCIYISSTYN